jgi:hypothetical protein
MPQRHELTAAGFGLIAAFAIASLPLRGDQSEGIRQQSRKAVSDCAAQVAVGHSREIEYSWKKLCRRSPEQYQGERTHYTVSRKTTDLVEVRTEVPLKLMPAGLSRARRDLLVQRTRECMPIVNQYWSRYGVHLEFDIRASRQGESHPNLLSVTDATGRSNSRNFFFRGLDTEARLPTGQTIKSGLAQLCQSQCTRFGTAATACAEMCEPFRQKEYCLMIVHEFGHLLALPDEYSDPDLCPDREFVSQESSPYSAMAYPYFGIADEAANILAGAGGTDLTLVEFFPRHLERVVGPLCGRNPPELDGGPR